ncbi:MAG TPA: LutB/LldF family L-lactate oxidation iron-sulfur protein [Pyrinomonadaceae bacterium]|nr:LutB/LldF family L-lactate oxidation iron-sulfur protein [Pyrinomonadaceae bacterium]
MNHLSSETFDENAKAALADVQLRGALRHATSLFGKRRLEAARSLGNWEDLRSQARAIKDEVLLHLDRYLETFVANAEKRGAMVHWATDAAEANAIICKLARDREARTIVKSKSMTTEETHLNDALEAAGMQVVETDLGEYIIQLAHETPSHIIAPAIHKTKGQVAELFTSTLGSPPTDDVAQLTRTARATLRDRFAAADVGISGVNFGVAETGTIVIVENEGNIRLTTSLPRVHIAVMGIEKVIPRFADLDLFLKLLPRSGTGQRLTTYQSFITGTKRDARDEGPDELHIVILDNGRSRMLAHPVTRQSLACIRCGACLNACPVYQQIGGHAYGSVYPGPIGAVITPQLMGLEKTAQLPYASSLCGACREVCPVKIDIPRLLLHLRSEIVAKQRNGSAAERLAFKVWARVMMSPALYEMGSVAARLTQKVFPLSKAWTSGRDLRTVERESFRKLWKTKLSHE